MDSYRKRDPGPQPDPVCHNNCGAVYREGARLEEITCRCGFGYYDVRQKKFVEGSLVREGRAPSREQYVAHVRQCQLAERGAPILRKPREREPDLPMYLGAHHPDDVSGERVSADVAAQTSSSVQPSRHAEDTRILSSTRHTTSRATEQMTTTSIRRDSGATALAPVWSFVPREGIELPSLAFFIHTFIDKDAKLKVGPHWEVSIAANSCQLGTYYMLEQATAGILDRVPETAQYGIHLTLLCLSLEVPTKRQSDKLDGHKARL
jgi:hypothetical protein